MKKITQWHFENTMWKINILHTVKLGVNFALNSDNSQTAHMCPNQSKKYLNPLVHSPLLSQIMTCDFRSEKSYNNSSCKLYLNKSTYFSIK